MEPEEGEKMDATVKQALKDTFRDLEKRASRVEELEASLSNWKVAFFLAAVAAVFGLILR